MATPIEEASRRWASWVEFSATTAKTTSPGLRYFTPSFRASILQFGGKMEETRTRFWAAMPASRKANSNDVNRSRCFPTPLVKNIRLGTMSLPNAVASGQRNNECENAQSNTMLCKESMNFAAGSKKAGTRWRESRPCRPENRRGGLRAKANYCNTAPTELCQRLENFRFPEQARPSCTTHFAATELTSMLSPFRTPVTV